MQTQKSLLSIKAPYGDKVHVPSEYWDELTKRNLNEISDLSLSTPHPPEGLVLKVLQDNILINFQDRKLCCFQDSEFKQIQTPFLELMILVYLCNVTSFKVTNKFISFKDLKDAQFFQGPHELKTAPLIERFGYDLNLFIKAAKRLGGIKLDQADAGFTFYIFPKIPLHYLLWCGDEEFSPHISILFDKSIERHLAADAIWGIVSIVSDALVLF